MVDYIVFDLDGTLLDTLEGLTLAVNEALSELNAPYFYSKEEMKNFIGNGAHKLLTKALKRKPTEEEFALFLKKYESCQYVSKAFPNVISTLKELENIGIKLIILSNKPDYILQKLIANNLKGIKFSYIQGQDFNYPPKPDVTLLNVILKKLDLIDKKGLFVGDSIVDVLTANNANLNSIILTYGYGKKEDLNNEKAIKLIDNFEEVKKYIWHIKKN